MDFWMLPPEVNSARLYSGPGSGPLMVAATAWDELAAELRSTATAWSEVILGLTHRPWQGASSASMASAAGSYAAWIRGTAAWAEETAAQARAAAGAYETALAMTVHPTEVAVNRTTTVSLAETNVLGQNTPAIAANEARYGDMWVQDIVAMEGYAGSSAAASNLPAVAPPPPSANPAGAAGPAADLPDFSTILAIISVIDEVFTDVGANVSIAIAAASLGVAMASMGQMGGNGNNSGGAQGSTEPEATQVTLTSRPTQSAPNLGTVSARGGQAASLGALSVPPSWSLPPQLRLVASTLPSTPGTPIVLSGNAGNSYAELILAGLIGGSLGGIAAKSAPGSEPATAEPGTAPAAAAAATARQPAPTVVRNASGSAHAELAAVLAAMPGATVIVVPPAQAAN